MKIRLNEPSISNLEKKYVNDVINKNWLSADGEHTKIFEKKLSKYLNLKNGFAVQSGTAALHAALKGLNINKNDSVVVPNYTCLSNLSSVTLCGANPIIVEVESDTLGLDYNHLKKAIKIYKPKAVQLVHVYGFVARDTIKIRTLCRQNNIKLLEDNSEGLGATLNKKKTGSFGDITINSIRSEKMIGVGEGGFIATNNKKIFDKSYYYASRSIKHRTLKDPYWKKYYADGEGCNYKLPHLLGAFGRGQIERFDYILKNKIRVGNLYRTTFRNEKYTLLSKIIKGSKPVYWLNGIYLPKSNFNLTIKIGNELIKNGIEIRSGFWPLNKQSGFKFKYIGGKNISQDIFNKSIILPSAYNLTSKKIEFIKSTLDRIIKKYL